MQSKILKKYILEELIYFESEDLNYFQNAFSSDVDTIVCNVEDENSWCSMDVSTTTKPLTLLLDLEAIDRGVYTGRVKGFYLFEMNIAELKTYEGDQKLLDKAEYYQFDTPNESLIEELDTPLDEVSFRYTEGFKEHLLSFICDKE